MDTKAIRESWNDAFTLIKSLNPNITERRKDATRTEAVRSGRLQKVLVANRGEIAKRFFFALHEEGIPSVAIVTDADVGQSWYDFADEVVHIGDSTHYTNIKIVIGAAIMTNANAIYPGYGFLSEKADFVRAINEASEAFGKKIIFMGPKADVMDSVGDKVKARMLAKANNVQLLDGEDEVQSVDHALKAANRIGYPLMVKLSAGGGGRGIVPCYSDEELVAAVESVQRLGKSLYNDDVYFLEKLVEKPVHMEVQIFNGVAIGIRKCAVQRRNQKIIEECGHTLVNDSTALAMLAQAQTISKISGYSDGCGAGTVEYLFDADTGKFGFLEMNTRLQVEYTVTEQSLGVDIVRWQILEFDGRTDEIPFDVALKNRLLTKNHAIECRVYAEEPGNDYRPSPGNISEIILPTFNGVRCDFGFATNDRVASMYDAMIGKIVAYGSDRQEAIIRLERALQEIYVKGLHTNVQQLLAIVRHPEFIKGNYTNKLLDIYPELHTTPVKGGYELKNERRGRSVIVIGTLAEYIRLVREKSEAFMSGRRYEVSMEMRQKLALPYKFNVHYKSIRYTVDIYQVAMDKYYVMVDGEYCGKVFLASGNPSKGDYIFRYGSRSYRLRVDRRPKHLSLRLKDGTNKFSYHRLEVIPEGVSGSADPLGMVRSPFQCTFVNLAKDSSGKDLSNGMKVKKGDALLVISSMKMETKVIAPIDGTIEFIIEDGNQSKLILGTTSDGRILGKSIQESDVLFMIKPDKKESAADDDSLDQSQFKKAYPTSWFVSEGEIEKYFLKDPQKFMPLIAELLFGTFRGFIRREQFLKNILDLLEKVDEGKWREVLTPKTETRLCALISYYYNILRLFSPVIREGVSYFEEANRYLLNLSNYEYRPMGQFKDLMTEILESYDIMEVKPSIDGESNMNSVAFMNIQHSYYVCYENREVIRKLVRILSFSPNALPVTEKSLSLLIVQEQSEPDDSLAVFARKALSEKFPHAVPGETTEVPLSAIDPLSACCSLSESLPSQKELEKKIRESLSAKNSISALKGILFQKVELLSKRFTVSSLYSPFDDVFIFSNETKDGKTKSYYAYLVPGKNIYGESCLLANQASKVLSLIGAYQSVESRKNNIAEVLPSSDSIKADVLTNSVPEALINLIKSDAASIKGMLSSASVARMILNFDVLRNGKTINELYELVVNESGIKCDIFAKRDISNPYTPTADPKEVNIFNLGKWPIDVWADCTFDDSTYEEIIFDTIDKNVPGSTDAVKVAAKVYVGLVNGIKACFYMKDSRIQGGATGDLEGLKYLAAVYLSYLNGWPLYVWNDGAGANILQGMVSLNRGAEGFMMNTMSANMKQNEFLEYAHAAPSDRVKDLFRNLDKKYFADGYPSIRSYHFVAAVGIGSSAGLDVYGSSQAPVQIILDSEQSYRVLTGSNVIRSVMGENISNYEIGGARVMSNWAGVVDLVARDKAHLVSIIRRTQSLLAFEKSVKTIARRSDLAPANDACNFSEITAEVNVDNGDYLPFKQEYYGSASVVAGFAKLGGRRVCVIAPRSAEGLRSYASVTRARDVLRSSARLGIHPILVLGKKMNGEAEVYDPSGVRARIDFVNTLASHKGVRIGVLTDIRAFHAIDCVAHFDVIIYVDSVPLDDVEREFVERNSTIIVKNISEAFDRARDVIDLVDPIDVTPGKPSGAPSAPNETGTPYDMIESVIKPMADNGLFVEFYSAHNKVQTRSNFITGLSRINGETVGVLSDQPLVLGGGADAPCTEKFRIFVQFVNRFNLKLLMLSNSSGFIPGTKQERFRIQAVGAEALDTNISGKVPVVSVVVNQNYGGRQIQAFSKYLRPGIHSIARENATMAVLGHTVAFDLFKAKKYNDMIAAGEKDEAEKMKKEFIDTYLERARAKNDASATGAVDEVIHDMKDLREMIIGGFKKAEKLVKDAFGN